jgi:hypothetical protein
VFWSYVSQRLQAVPFTCFIANSTAVIKELYPD